MIFLGGDWFDRFIGISGGLFFKILLFRYGFCGNFGFFISFVRLIVGNRKV